MGFLNYFGLQVFIAAITCAIFLLVVSGKTVYEYWTTKPRVLFFVWFVLILASLIVHNALLYIGV